MKELINIYSDLLEKHFPKHKCKERGQALVLIAELNIAILSLIKSKQMSVDEIKKIIMKHPFQHDFKLTISVDLATAIHKEQLKRLEGE